MYSMLIIVWLNLLILKYCPKLTIISHYEKHFFIKILKDVKMNRFNLEIKRGIDIKSTPLWVASTGIEPVTQGFSVLCSTI